MLPPSRPPQSAQCPAAAGTVKAELGGACVPSHPRSERERERERDYNLIELHTRQSPPTLPGHIVCSALTRERFRRFKYF